MILLLLPAFALGCVSGMCVSRRDVVDAAIAGCLALVALAGAVFG